jgi:hypothetical protein
LRVPIGVAAADCVIIGRGWETSFHPVMVETAMWSRPEAVGESFLRGDLETSYRRVGLEKS